MKLAFLFVSLLSAQAFPCPNLVGKWACVENTKRTYQFEIQQQQPIPNGMRYTSISADGTVTVIEADGTTRPYNIIKNGTGTLMAQCLNENSLKMVISEDIDQDKLSSESTSTLVDQNTFESHTKTTMIHDGQQSVEEYSSACSRQ